MKIRQFATAILLVAGMVVSTTHADLQLDINGTAGSGFTVWTFSTVIPGMATADGTVRDLAAGPTFSTNDTAQFGTNNGIANALIQDALFNLTGSAVLTVGGVSESITGIFLDDDGTGAGDDLGIRVTTPLAYLAGDAVTWSGSGTVAGVDITDFEEGTFQMDFGALWLLDGGNTVVNIAQSTAIPEPASATVIAMGAIGLIARRRRA